MYSHSRKGVKEGEESEMPEEGIDSIQINGKNNRENSLKENENIVIDKSSLEILKGSMVEYKNELIGNSFKITNPKTKSSCGCGISFSL